jgi:leukotriene-A4 hydrolase
VPLPLPCCTGAKFILENTVEFVTSQGRMKYVRPLYREMFKSPMAKTLAIETFLKHASSYHPIARKMVAADLHIKTGEAGASAEANGGASHAARALKLDRSVLALLVIGTAALGVALFLARKKGVKRA